MSQWYLTKKTYINYTYINYTYTFIFTIKLNRNIRHGNNLFLEYVVALKRAGLFIPGKGFYSEQ